MFCRNCGNDTNGAIMICKKCNAKVCLNCGTNEYCKDCFIEENKTEILGDYYKDKKKITA